jgi:hypothetical protein
MKQYKMVLGWLLYSMHIFSCPCWPNKNLKKILPDFGKMVSINCNDTGSEKFSMRVYSDTTVQAVITAYKQKHGLQDACLFFRGEQYPIDPSMNFFETLVAYNKWRIYRADTRYTAKVE